MHSKSSVRKDYISNQNFNLFLYDQISIATETDTQTLFCNEIKNTVFTMYKHYTKFDVNIDRCHLKQFHHQRKDYVEKIFDIKEDKTPHYEYISIKYLSNHLFMIVVGL